LVLVHDDLAGADARDDVPSSERPLGSYAALAALFTIVFLVPLAIAGGRGSLPRRPRAGDVALVGVGTFKVSRLLTTAAVTGFIRAPFVRFEGMEGVTTPKESPRGRGMRRAVGQLLLCSKCMGPWVAAALVTGLVRAPRATRVACTALAAATVNDLLQTVRKAASRRGAASGPPVGGMRGSGSRRQSARRRVPTGT
jgi:hypothetical protein